MARTRIKVNQRGVNVFLHSGPLRRHLLDKAEKVAAQAKRTAPKVSGTYADHIDAWLKDQRTMVVARAGSHVDYATAVEAAHRVLGRAIDAARG